jgi:hypothetical protein
MTAFSTMPEVDPGKADVRPAFAAEIALSRRPMLLTGQGRSL